jgi:hypothetical protein
MFLWHKLAYSSTRLFSKWRTTVEIFIKFSQKLNATNRPKYEIEYSVSIPIDISNKKFGCQCPLIRIEDKHAK